MNLKEFEKLVKKIFKHPSVFGALSKGKKYAFRIDTEWEIVSFDKLQQLSRELKTTLIDITGGEEVGCPTCGGTPFCDITVTLE